MEMEHRVSKSELMSVLFILLFAVSPVYGNFDYLQLVLTWPATFCYRPKNICKRTANNFTIHGLWPEKEEFRLEFCTGNKYNHFSVKDSIVNDLEKEHHWIQLKFDEQYARNNQPLWSHEYTKHGMCSSNLYDQRAYFLLAMRLKDKFDLLTTFRTHRITPGTKHTFDEIQSAIKTVTNKVVADLKCVQHIKGVQELKEIGICFTPEADSFHPCRQGNTCDESMSILFR